MSDPSFDTLFSFLRQPSLIPGPIRLLLHTAASSLVVLGTTSKSPAACLRSPQKKRDIKRLFFFFFFLSQGSVDTSISEPSLSFGLQVERRRWNPLWLFVCKSRSGGEGPFRFFPAETAPRLKLSHWSHSRQHVPPQPLLSLVLS